MNDDTTRPMQTAPNPPPPNPRRLVRSRSDRMLGGVAGGLAQYFDVDPVIFRIAFGVSLFFGGLGFFVYLVMAIFVPSERSDAPGEPGPRRSVGGWLVLAVASLAGLIALLALGLVAALAAATGSGELVALLVIVIGAVLALAAFRGGARWLILPALALALPLGTVAAADIEFDGGIGERTHRPLAAKAIPAAGYELGIGDQRIDLRGIRWSERTQIELTASHGVGRLLILVPEDVCVTGTASARAGVIDIAGAETDGFDPEFTRLPNGTAGPQLELDAELEVGRLQVVNDDDVEIGSVDADRGDSIGRDALRDRMAAACTRGSGKTG